MKTVLITGASGGIGTRLRRLLRDVFPYIRLSDLAPPADLAKDEVFVRAELGNLDEIEAP